MATIDGIGLAEPSTITKSLAAVSIERNSSVTYQEVMVIGSPNSTTATALAEVTGSAPASTTVGLVVRVAEPSTGPFAISSIAGVTLVGQNSTTWPVQVSSVAGVVSVQQNSTVFAVQARTVIPTMITVTSTAGSDTTATIISSAATTPRIAAYTVVSTVAGPVQAGFYAGSTLLWPVLMWADGGVPKDAQAVAPPGFLFSGQANRPVQFSVASTGHYTVALTYWQE